MIALTDGNDNNSSATKYDIIKLIIENQIILDSFVVQTEGEELKQITLASGGQIYCPKTINEGLRLFEAETIISVDQRGKINWHKIR